jgi:RecB family exonuclease
MMCVADRRYVQPTREFGIPVYEYRVSAGICPDHHFVLGVSQEASQVINPAYRFLPLHAMPDKVRDASDFTESFLDLYEHSGKEVYFSAGSEDFDGPATPLERFMAGEKTEPTPADNDFYSKEYAFWKGTEVSLDRLYQTQREGFLHAAGVGLREKGHNLTKDPIADPGLARAVFERQTGEDGKVRISPTSLDMWTDCKFRYLLYRALGIEELEYDVVYTSALEKGNLLHDLLAKVTRKVDGLADEAEKKAVASRVFSESFTGWAGARFLPPVLRDLRRQAVEYIHLFLKEDEKRFPQARVHALEDTLQISVNEPEVLLYGRIDRISKHEGGYIVIDYKSRLRNKRAGMVSKDGTIKTYQIPIYLLLVENAYGAVAEALYYDIRDGAYQNVFGGEKPWFGDEERDQLLIETRRAVSTMYRGIASSNYQTPAPGDGCERCGLRPICREKYRVK